MKRRRVLVAGIGNILMGDDGFGVAVVRSFATRTRPEGVVVMDAGTRGIDLASALMSGYDAAILVDTVDRGGPPGTLYVIEPGGGEEADAQAGLVDAHGMRPSRVLSIARSLGTVPGIVRVVGCQPETMGSPDDPVLGLSPNVQAAVPSAVELVETLVAELSSNGSERPGPPSTHA